MKAAGEESQKERWKQNQVPQLHLKAGDVSTLKTETQMQSRRQENNTTETEVSAKIFFKQTETKKAKKANGATKAEKLENAIPLVLSHFPEFHQSHFWSNSRSDFSSEKSDSQPQGGWKI